MMVWEWMVMTMELSPDQKRAEQVLYEIWYSVAETIFEKVCEVTELDHEQKEALRSVALRPNDFHIYIYDSQREVES